MKTKTMFHKIATYVFHKQLALTQSSFCSKFAKGLTFFLAILMCVSNALAQNGTILGNQRIGIGFNNRYVDGPSKTDWIEFGVDENDTLLQGIDDLSNLLDGGFRTFRCGWSRNMGLDPADMQEWIDGLEEIINAGNEVMVVFWGAYPPGGPGKISDPQGDSILWEQAVDLIEANGLLDGVAGWEIMNEPNGNGESWRNYVRAIYKNVGPHDNVAWNQMTPQQFADTAAAWHNKPIVVQGTGFGQNFPNSLVDGLAEVEYLVWSAHHYAMFSNINAERQNWTVEQWRDFLLDDWADRHQSLNGQLIVTELGNSNDFDRTLTGLGPVGTTVEDRRAAGFIRAARQYYGLDSTVYWYTAYNTAPIGIGELFYSGWNNRNIDAINYVFNGLFEPSKNGISNVALGKPVSVSSANSSNPGSAAVDGNREDNSSRWVSQNGVGFPHTIEIDLENEFSIGELRLYTGFNNKYEKPIYNISFERFVDGAWEEIVQLNDNNNPAVRIPFAPVVADRVRLVANGGVDETMRLYEIEILGTAPEIGEALANFDFANGSAISSDSSEISLVQVYDTSAPNSVSGNDSGVSSSNQNAFLRAQNTPEATDPFAGNIWYHSFAFEIQNLQTGQTLDLTTLDFDYGPTTNGNIDGGYFEVGLFSDQIGYASAADRLAIARLEGDQNLDGTFTSHDLRFLESGEPSLGFTELANGDVVEFRFYFADNSIADNNIHRIDNIRVHGLVRGEGILLGDVNCDGELNLLDVAPFVELLISDLYSEKADVNSDGVLNLLDVEPFVLLLTGG